MTIAERISRVISVKRPRKEKLSLKIDLESTRTCGDEFK